MMNKKGNVMKHVRYCVYQLPFENENSRNLYFMAPKEIEEISDQYELVCQIDARSMDEAFRIGNFVLEEDRSLIEVVGEMHSISVGDIIHNLETDETFLVMDYGFTKIEMKEAV